MKKGIIILIIGNLNSSIEIYYDDIWRIFLFSDEKIIKLMFTENLLEY